MTESHERVLPSYYAIIPAEVRFCKNLEPSAKLLYGELTALTSIEGFCWASNRYLADLYEIEIRTLQRWLSSLEEQGFIEIECTTNSFNTKRKITLCHSFKKSSTARQKCHPPMTEVSPPHDKNVTHSITPSITQEKQQQQDSGDSSFAGCVVVVSSLEKLDEPSVTEHDKKRLSATYPERVIIDAIKVVQEQGAPESFLKSLNAACKGEWKPKSESKNIIEENWKYAKEIEDILNLDLVNDKGYTFIVGKEGIAIKTHTGHGPEILYQDPQFMKKFNYEVDKRFEGCFYS